MKKSELIRVLQEKTAKDAELAPHHKKCEVDAGCRSRDGYRLQGRLLWKVDNGHYQLMVPNCPALREFFLRENHDADSAGHLGRRKTTERMTRNFWWRNMTVDNADYVKSCVIFQATKSGNHKPYVELHPITAPLECWQTIAMDFVTSLPLTVRGLSLIHI